MRTWFFECWNDLNHGKFMVGAWEGEEWARREEVNRDPAAIAAGVVPPEIQGFAPPMFLARGWGGEHLLVLDLETGEGAIFPVACGLCPSYADADLKKHAIWVCPLFPHFLQWLYDRHLGERGGPDLIQALDALPRVVDLSGPEVRRSMAGRRYPGGQQKDRSCNG